MTPEETYNDQVLECPYCHETDNHPQHLGDDGSEYANEYGIADYGETECGSCEKKFHWSRSITVWYTGRPKQ